MKVFKNRALAVLLALCMMLSLLPVTAMAAVGDPVEKLAVSVASNGKITVKSSSGGEYTPKETLWYQSADMWDDPSAYDADGKLAQLTVGMTSDGVNGLDNLVGTIVTWHRLAEDCNNELIAADRSQSCFVWVVDASGDEHSLTLYAAGYAIYSPGGSGSNGGNSGNGSGGQGGGDNSGNGGGGQDAEDNRLKLESLIVNNGANLITEDTYGTGDGTWETPWDASAVIGKDEDSFTFKAEFNDTDADAYYRLMPVDDSAAPQLVSGKPVTINLNEEGKAEVIVALLPKGVKPAGPNSDTSVDIAEDLPTPTFYRLTVTNTGGSGNQGSGNKGGGGGGVSRPSTNPSASGSTATPSTPTTPTTPSTVGGFSDVPASNTFATQIAWAQANGYMGGYSDGTFRPNANTTRQALWMVLGRIAGAAPADMVAAREWAVAAGITDGTGAEGNMSRQQMITMLYRFAQSQGKTVTGSADLSGYSDSGVVASYAKEALAWGVANGIITGTTDGKLNPEGVATRAHFAAFLYRYCNLA